MNRIVLAHAAAATAALSAGAAVVATRFVVGEVDPLSLVFYRYVVAVLCLAPFLPAIWPRERPDAAAYAKIAAFGVLFFVLFPWAFNAALRHVPAARGAVGLATIPIQTLVVASVFGREKMTPDKVFGALLAFAGILAAYGTAAFASGGAEHLLGDGLMLLGVLCAAVYSVLSRPVLLRHGPLFVTAMGMIFAVAALLPYMELSGGLAALPTLSATGWASLLFLGTLAGAVQFSLFMWALRSLPSTTTVLYLTLNPITAMLLGVLVLGESLTAELLVGMGLVVGGILVGAGALRRPGKAA